MLVETRPRPLLIDSCYGSPTRRVPVWILRQASRYLPEYRELRDRVPYRDICTTPEHAADATMQPVRRFGLDAGALIVDPLLALEQLGVEVTFTDDGPRIADPVRSRLGLDRLRIRGDVSDTFLPGVTAAAHESLGETPLIAVAGAPFTLAGFLVEGRRSLSLRHLKAFLYNDPEAAHQLMEQLADLATAWLEVQFEAGASAFILYDSWAGLLGTADYRAHVAPFVTDVFRRVASRRRPGILYVNEAGHLVDMLVRTGAEVLAPDWRVDLERMRTRLPENISIQGNLDPAVLLGPPDLIRHRVLDLLIQGTLYRGHILNLGGGILPDTPPENVQVMVDVVRDFDPGLQGWQSVRP